MEGLTPWTWTGGELEVSARFPGGTVKIEPFDEAGGGDAVLPWIPGGFGKRSDRVAYASGCWPGSGLLDGIGWPQGFQWKVSHLR